MAFPQSPVDYAMGRAALRRRAAAGVAGLRGSSIGDADWAAILLMTAAIWVGQRKDASLNRAALFHLLRRAATMPPHRAVAKAARFLAGRRARAAWERHQDLTRGTHPPLTLSA